MTRTKSLKIIGLGGSGRPSSTSAAALGVALAGARAAGAEVSSYEIDTLDLPMYSYGAHSEVAAAFADAVHHADGMIWCSPLYHGSISGAFKNALDWLELLATRDPPYLMNKVVGLIALSGGEQALQAINTMEFIVRALRGWTLPLTAPILRSTRAFDADGRPRDEALRARLAELGGEVVRAAGSFAGWAPER